MVVNVWSIGAMLYELRRANMRLFGNKVDLVAQGQLGFVVWVHYNNKVRRHSSRAAERGAGAVRCGVRPR